MSMLKTLVINSYAGSITLGASTYGSDIIGSYEDKGFFHDVQKHNFPSLKFVSYAQDWPAQDLSDTVVVAHPPCSAFSLANNSPTARGVDSDAFACTKVILNYAMGNNAKAIAIESVLGALPGAWNVHTAYAEKYGYHLYRIIENGIMFGAQWRERCWFVWVKKDAAPETMKLTITPRYKTVKEVITGYEDGPSAGNQDVLLTRQMERLLANGCTHDDLRKLFEPQDPPYGTRSLASVLWEVKFKQESAYSYEKDIMRIRCIGDFGQGALCFIDPNGFAPVIMGGSFWHINGRCMSENAFKVLMGFPAEYVFLESPRNYRKNMRTGLSKGVMPPIAHWIIEMLAKHLGVSDGMNNQHDAGYQLEVGPEQIADFRIKKKDWWERDTALPQLYDHEEPENITTGPVSFEAEIPMHRIPKPRVTKTGRTVNVTGPIRVSSRLNGSRIVLVNRDNLTTGLTDTRRLAILDIVDGLNQPTLLEAVSACIIDPRVPILPTTCEWHIKQLIKSGNLSFAQA